MNWGFPGDPVVKNLPCNAGDGGSIPGRRTKIPHATVERLSPCATLESLCTATTSPRPQLQCPWATVKDPQVPQWKILMSHSERSSWATVKDPHEPNEPQWKIFMCQSERFSWATEKDLQMPQWKILMSHSERSSWATVKDPHEPQWKILMCHSERSSCATVKDPQVPEWKILKCHKDPRQPKKMSRTSPSMMLVWGLCVEFKGLWED